YIISPKSEIFPLDPVPTNPCWAVRSLDGDYILVTIIDAITGDTLGYGTPPPYEGLSIHGPDWGDCPQDPIWYSHANNAKTWFEAMGYTTLQVGNASDATVAGHIQSDDGAMFYELDHGGYSSFHNQCNATIYATEVESWIASYASMPFAFIGSCEGLCSTGDNTFSYEFRKGFSQDTVTVGYCGMSSTACSTCWSYSISWQTALFDYMDQGYTAQQAFNHANAYYPTCAGTNNCMRIAGDTGMRFVPNVRRSYCGSLSGGSLLPYYMGNSGDRSAHIRCNITAAGTYGIYILPNTEMVFLNNAEVIATNSVYGSSSSGPIRMVSEQNRSRGMEMSGGGQLRMSNGGQIKVYE
ncbi:MAG: hypothetical protein JW810_11770, partial [Sedimentisphaerales bacterium]|nr:hypothetical protein [Sedimentisphaerales bacterium]